MHYGPCPIVRDCLAAYPALLVGGSMTSKLGLFYRLKEVSPVLSRPSADVDFIDSILVCRS